MKKTIIGVEFLIGLAVIIFIVLPIAYYCAKQFLNHQVNEGVPNYLRSELSEDSEEEFEPPFLIGKKEEEKPLQNIKEKQISHAIQLFNYRKNEIIRQNDTSSSLQLSAERSKVKLSYQYVVEENRLTVNLVKLSNITKKENGGPERLRFKVYVTDKKYGTNEYNEKLKTNFIIADDAIPVAFKFYRVTRDLLEALAVKIVIEGMRKEMIRTKKARLGAVYTKLQDLNEYEFITKSVLPCGKEI